MSTVRITKDIGLGGAIAGKIIPDDPTKPTIVLTRVEKFSGLIIISGKLIKDGSETEINRCSLQERVTGNHNIKGPDVWIEELEKLEATLFPEEQRPCQ